MFRFFSQRDMALLLLPIVIVELIKGRTTYSFILKGDSSSSRSSFFSIKSYIFEDFSSPAEWEAFYQENAEGDVAATFASSRPPPPPTEWHESIPLDEIASVVPPNGRCLVIGCGNSNLPDRILQRGDHLPPPRSLVLLDTSQTCLDQLRERHNRYGMTSHCGSGNTMKNATRIEYTCGDATKLSTYFPTNVGVEEGDNDDDEDDTLFDMIIDKGLTDAILCGEGWDGPLEKVFSESAKILSKGSGQYLLISYRLPASTKEFLVSVGERVGLKWEFDFNLTAAASTAISPSPSLSHSASSSNQNRGENQHRVSVSVAKMKTVNKCNLR